MNNTSIRTHHRYILFFSFLSLMLFFCAAFSWSAIDKALYPHWKLDDPAIISFLEKLETFIAHHAHKQQVVVFDWDGTVYNEKIPVKEYNNAVRSGQSAWHLWAGANLKKYSFLFPLFRLKDYDESKKYLFYHDDFLEEKNTEKPLDYAKFSQIACIEAGMSVPEMEKGIRMFLKEPDYAVRNHVFIPLFDVLQRFADNGFIIYFISGSNPYYIKVVLETIQKDIPYTNTRKYSLGVIEHTPYRLLGNCARLGKNNRFTLIYDDTYVKHQAQESYVVNKEGKAIAIERYLEGALKLPKPIFAAGNSGSDNAMISYCVKANDFPNTWGLAVDARSGLPELAQQLGLGVIHADQVAKQEAA